MITPRHRPLTRARIEIIPLIDVIFFLLATFVLFTLSLNKIGSMELTLPASTPKPLPGVDPIVLSVTAHGGILWDRAPVALGELPTRLALLREAQPHARVLIGGDIHAKFGTAVAVLDHVRAAGIEAVSMETRVRPAGY